MKNILKIICEMFVKYKPIALSLSYHYETMLFTFISFVMKKFTFRDITLDKVTRENGKIYVDFTYKYYGVLKFYHAVINDKYDLRLKSEKEFLCITLAHDFSGRQ